MVHYLFRRLLLFVPSLLLIAYLVLWLSSQSVDDPVETVDSSATVQSGATEWKEEREKETTYWSIAEKYHLNLPLFYFTVQSMAYEDSLNQIVRRNYQQNMVALVRQYGNGKAVWNYYKTLQKTHEAIYSLPQDSVNIDVRTNLLKDFTFL